MTGPVIRMRAAASRTGGFTWRLVSPVGLSARLLLLTAAFVMLGALLIIGPSLAAYEEGWLTDRVRLAEVASLAVEASPAGTVSDKLAGELLEGAGVISVSVQTQGVRRLLLAAPRFARAPVLIDLRRSDPAAKLAAPFVSLTRAQPTALRVVARPRFRGGDFVEIVLPEQPLQRDLRAYLLRLLATASFVSAVAGLVVYVTLRAFLVRPIQRITAAMERFRARPDDPAARLPLSHRQDEIGRAEAELARMQEDLTTALHSSARLAALGGAVARINHDLRNMLTSARMASDRLAGPLSDSDDPRVTLALPRLERALDRAQRLAEEVLAYGKSDEPPPQPQAVSLAAALDSAAEDAGLEPGGVAFDNAAGEANAHADPEQLHRILVNLMRNARQAIQGAGRPAGRVRAAASVATGATVILISDDGPGMPARARAHLFEPFGGSASAGGAGLGLAIARELARAHGGDLELASSDPGGAVFRLILPGAPQARPEPPARTEAGGGADGRRGVAERTPTR